MAHGDRDMSPQMLEQIVKSIGETDCDDITIAIHGGEPLIRPISFFEELFELEKRYCADKKILNTFQTNGSLIDDTFLDFVCSTHTDKIKFEIGLSIDGPAFVHDTYRVDAAGKGTLSNILSSVKSIQERGKAFGILSVYSDLMAQRPKNVYEFFADLHGRWDVDFLLPQTNTGDKPQHLGQFYIDIFDIWVNDEECDFGIRFLSSVLCAILNQRAQMSLCTLTGNCFKNGRTISIETDGRVDHCDCYGVQIGHITDDSIDDLLSCNIKRRELDHHYKQARKNCVFCKWISVCNGGCPIDFNDGKQYYCEDFKKIFSHVEQWAIENNLLHFEGDILESVEQITNPYIRDLLSKAYSEELEAV